MESESRSGLRCGCQALLVLLLLVVAWDLVRQGQVLERLGLRRPAWEQVFVGPPDREAAQAIRAEMDEARVFVPGLTFYVLPMATRRGQALVLLLDASAGFDAEESLSPALGVLDRLLKSELLNQWGIEQVIAEYRGLDGQPLVTLTTPLIELRDVFQGRSSEREFIRTLQGNADLWAVLMEVLR